MFLIAVIDLCIPSILLFQSRAMTRLMSKEGPQAGIVSPDFNVICLARSYDLTRQMQGARFHKIIRSANQS